MADITGEEHLDKPANSQSESPSKENLIKDTEVNIPNQEIENMEVINILAHLKEFCIK